MGYSFKIDTIKRIPGALYLWASVQNTKYKVQQRLFTTLAIKQLQLGYSFGVLIKFTQLLPQGKNTAHFNFSAVSFLQGQDGRVTTIA